VTRGGCLCGEVRYEIRGEPRSLTHCHCSMCRKAHGAAFATFIEIPAKDFQLVRGADRLVRYASSPGSVRPFCPRCGATLFFQTETEEEVWVAAGSLDGDAEIAPSVPRSHSYVASKAPWLHLADGLPRFDGEVA
jgi:hypothetical protein